MRAKVVLITGASRGIGAATAKLFAKKGYSVCLNYKRDAAAAEAVKVAVESCGVSCIAVQADVTRSAEVEHLFECCDRQLGRIGVLVNNAGILHRQASLLDISEERFREVMTTNVLSCFLCCQQAVKRMATSSGGSGGAIVNVSSAAARTGSPHEYVDYAASKGAMDALTRGLALEVAAEGVRVNGVRPGLIHTDIHASGGEPGRVDRLAHKVPLQRGGQPGEVAEAIWWLASGSSSFVVGSFIEPTGGL